MDLKITEQENGGDLTLNGNDLEMVFGYENQPYLGTVGGNKWWGNDLLLKGGNDFILSAQTEELLNTIVINSANRVKVEQAIINDLAYLKKHVPGTTIEVQVIIASDDRLDISIWVNGELFTLQWNVPGEPVQVQTVPINPPFPEGMIMWCKADEGYNIDSTGGFPKLADWDDQSGNNNALKLLAGVGGSGQIFANVLNGWSVIKMDGDTVYGTSGGSPVQQFDDTDQITVIIVKQLDLTAAAGNVIVSSDGANYNAPGKFTVSAGPSSISATLYDPPSGGQTTGFFGADNAPRMYTYSFDCHTNGMISAPGAGILIHGVSGLGSSTGMAPAGNFANGYFAIGDIDGNNAFSGFIAEVLIFDHVLDGTEFDQVETYLVNKFGL